MRLYNATAPMDKPLLYPPAVSVVRPIPKTKYELQALTGVCELNWFFLPLPDSI
jgi:hypothetical protein